MSESNRGAEVVVAGSAAESMQAEADSKWPLETGGILLGSHDSGAICVKFATGPGPRAKHGIASFSRDGDFAQRELDRFLAETLGEVDYVGEWHTHTLPMGPSLRDRKSMLFIASSSGYGAPDPLLLLCMPRRVIAHRKWMIRAFLLIASKLVEHRVAVERS